MRRTVRAILLVCLAAYCARAAAETSAFLPALQFKRGQGANTIRRPDEALFKPLKLLRAYPYGSVVETVADGWLLLEFAPKNECRILANSRVSFWQNDAHPWKSKMIEIERGQVEVRVEDGFQERNALSVVSAPVKCQALRGRFAVEVTPEADRHNVHIRCEDGNVEVEIPGLTIPTLDPQREILVSATPDSRFVSLRNLRGKCDVEILRDSTTVTNVAMRVDTMIKRWSQPVPNTTKQAVTVAIFSTDGKIEHKFHYVVEKATKE